MPNFIKIKVIRGSVCSVVSRKRPNWRDKFLRADKKVDVLGLERFHTYVVQES